MMPECGVNGRQPNVVTVLVGGEGRIRTYGPVFRTAAVVTTPLRFGLALAPLRAITSERYAYPIGGRNSEESKLLGLNEKTGRTAGAAMIGYR